MGRSGDRPGGDDLISALRRKPFAILRHLARHPQRLVTHEELLAEIWAGAVVSESAVRSHLHELRQVLGEGVIETVIGRGYRFVATLEAGADPVKEPKLERVVVGREAELATLRAALDRAAAGHRAVCFAAYREAHARALALGMPVRARRVSNRTSPSEARARAASTRGRDSARCRAARPVPRSCCACT